MVKNITLSADEDLIRRAREKATRESRSLNSVFREWLEQYTRRDQAAARYQEIMKQLSHIKLRGPFTRDEMNER